MKKIYKYVLDLYLIDEPQTIKVHGDASIINFDMQRTGIGPYSSNPVFWATVPPTASTEERTFILRFTGSEVDDNETYIGTATSHAGFVYHLFEIRK